MKGIFQKRFFVSIASAAVLLTLSASNVSVRTLCQGFVPKNDRYIPDDAKALRDGGMTREQFDSILDRVERIYGPIVQARGGVLNIQRKWDDGTVNASAERIGTTYRLNMYGGLARHPLITPDGFMLVACHEMGHQVGGKPKVSSFFGGTSWASVEGQSDYFGTAKCMRKMFLSMTPDELASFTSNSTYAEEQCATAFARKGSTAQTICVRNTLAGVTLGNVLSDLSGTGIVALETPTSAIYNGIDQRHPKAQCRLDTYFQGALCRVAHDVDYSDSNYLQGACAKESGDTVGLRSKCWFNPSRRTANKGVNQLRLPAHEVYY